MRKSAIAYMRWSPGHETPRRRALSQRDFYPVAELSPPREWTATVRGDLLVSTVNGRLAQSRPIGGHPMSEIDRSLPRRTVLQGAGIGIGASLLSGLSSAAQAQTAPAGEIWSADYWAKKGDVKLNLWRKRIGAPRPGETALPVVFLV